MDYDTKIRQRFGERVRFFRHSRAWLLEDLATRIGKSVTTLSRIETGRQNVTIVDVVALARALNCGIGDLLEETSGEPRSEEGGMLTEGALVAQYYESIELLREQMGAIHDSVHHLGVVGQHLLTRRMPKTQTRSSAPISAIA